MNRFILSLMFTVSAVAGANDECSVASPGNLYTGKTGCYGCNSSLDFYVYEESKSVLRIELVGTLTNYFFNCDKGTPRVCTLSKEHDSWLAPYLQIKLLGNGDIAALHNHSGHVETMTKYQYTGNCPDDERAAHCGLCKLPPPPPPQPQPEPVTGPQICSPVKLHSKGACYRPYSPGGNAPKECYKSDSYSIYFERDERYRGNFEKESKMNDMIEYYRSKGICI